MKFEKTFKTPEQCCDILLERGLNVEDRDRAIKYLKTVGYYRLTGYMFHLQERETHKFNEGVTFDEIINIYKFDKALRSIFLEYLERIEIALRASLTDAYGTSIHGFFWYRQTDYFDDSEVFDLINEDIAHSFSDPKEHFLKAFKDKYTDEDFPPSNMALETLSFGKLVRLFDGLKKSGMEKAKIAKRFNLSNPILSSWFIYLAHVRNICAHHSRLWNKSVTVNRATVPKRDKYAFKGYNLKINNGKEIANTYVYFMISMIDRLLDSFNPNNSFTRKIEELIVKYTIDTSFMGFPSGWEENANWNKKFK